METKATHTLEELKQAASKQNLRIEEKDGKYRVVRMLPERFSLGGMNVSAGYSFDQDGLREFLIFNSVDIGERLTDWSKERGHKRNHEKRMDL